MTGPPAAGGTLYVVATPIGNLGDVTLRALDVLRAVSLIAAEDTRVTARLLARYEVSTRTVSFHARNAAARGPELVAELAAGRDVAIVTDAGTPGVSDPGEELVRAWAGQGGVVVPIPGASAVLAAIAVAGVAGPRWSFEGFLPRSGRERRERLARLAADERTTVVFEAPGRVRATLSDLAAACGGERPAALCRELTKVHEQVVRGPLAELVARVADGTVPARGEFVLVVGDAPAGAASSPRGELDDARLASARDAVDALAAAGRARGDAAREVARQTGIPRRSLY